MVDHYQGVRYALVHDEVDYMVDNEALLKYMVVRKYLSPQEVMYDKRYPFCIGPYEWDSFLNFKDKEAAKKKDPFRVLDLVAFNGKPLHYVINIEVLAFAKTIMSLFSYDFKKNLSSVLIRNADDLIKSRIYSEIEGSLSVEAVQTTRRRVKQIIGEGMAPSLKNDFIIRNMGRGIDFVLKKPEFNEDNLYQLYSLLSADLLDDDDVLLEGRHYRHDEVEVDFYPGAPHEQISTCMDSLFSYVGHILEKGDPMEKFLLPHVAHYYIAYVHPYFDYNGRTARMVSFWLSLLSIQNPPVFASEAIDQTKNLYYRALENTRNSHNDLTYFIIYLLQITVSYYNCYRNVEYIDQLLKNKGIVLTEGERAYVKKILISNKGAFVYGDFLKWTKSDMSKQAAFKILNGFVRDGFLLTRESRSKNKLFAVNPEFAPYRMKYFNE